ncbi:bacterial Ig-like domain-containing protein [Carnobacterium maltaromaticum]|uniref:bacterial Ig-like domain-containing protein n=1 Tax=Carnobacterium maltaromaticum TaxID=2751 RepID=UPI0039BEC6B6
MKNIKKIVALTVTVLCLGDTFTPSLLKVYGTESDQSAESNESAIQDMKEENESADDLVESNEPNSAPSSELIDSSNLIKDADFIEEIAKKEPITEDSNEIEIINSVTPIEPVDRQTTSTSSNPITEKIIASGVSGSSTWQIDSDGTLHLGSGTPTVDFPWKKYSQNIKKVVLEGPIEVYDNTCRLLNSLTFVTEISGLNYLDTSNVANMESMFLSMYSLTTIDVSNLDTSNVTNMEAMFAGLKSLTTIDISNLDTSNVTNMKSMFSGMESLTTLNVSNLDTSNVTNMKSMFAGLNSLTTLDVSNFDTSNVTNMSYMFNNMPNLTSLNVSNLDTSNVTNMSYMFGGLNSNKDSLTTLDVTNFDTSNVTNMRDMFAGLNSLTTLDVSNFDTSNVTDMSGMFGGVNTLNTILKPVTSLDLSNFDTSNVTDMSSMFNGLSRLTSLDVSNFDTSNVTNMSNMFRDVYGISSSLDLSNFDTSNVTNMSRMFYGMTSVSSIDVSNFNTSKVTDMELMFYNLYRLQSIDLSNFNTSKVVNMKNMFSRAGVLNSIKLGEYFKFVNDVALTSPRKDAAIRYTDNWINERTKETLSAKELTEKYEGSTMNGEWHWQVDYRSITIKNSITIIYVGDKWNVADNFVSATDVMGNQIPFDPAMVSGPLDVTKPGSYTVIYTNGAESKSSVVKVKENKTSIDAKNSSIHVGDKWNAADNFVSATDKAGNQIPFDPTMVSGTVDVTKVGDYQVTYTNGGAKKEILVTVKENKTSIDAKNSSIHVGDKWNAADNFVSATDKDGNQIPFDPAMVSGTVDVTKVGDYQVTYTNGGAKKEILVTVKENKTSIDAKNSSIHVGDKWNAADNFVSATDKDGNQIPFDPAMVSGTVDVTKVGDYQVTYTNGGAKKEILVTVKENKTSIDAKNSSIHVGDKWNAADNFVSATDKDGNQIPFDPTMVSGTVDVTKVGDYQVTYTNGGAKKVILITVKENKTSIDAKNSSIYGGDKWNAADNVVSATDKDENQIPFDPTINNSGKSNKETRNNQRLPQAGEVQSYNILGLALLSLVAFISSKRKN